MAVPRPILLAILGLALVASAFLVTRGASDAGTVAPAPTPVRHAPAVKPSVSATPRAARPTQPSASTHTAAGAQSVGQAAAAAAAKAAEGHKAGRGVSAKHASPATLPAQGKLRPVIEAFNRGDVVVVFFSQPGSADDDGARAAVTSLAGTSGVSVSVAGLADVTLFRPLLTGTGVSQVPAVVVVRAGHKARVIQGYVDPATLRQTVTDARG